MSSARKNKVVSTAWTYSDKSLEKPKDDVNRQEGCQDVKVDESTELECNISDVNQRQPPEGGNEAFERKGTIERKSRARFYVTPTDLPNERLAMRRAASDNDIDVDIEIEVDLRELGTDIKKIIASMENLKLELGDLSFEEETEGDSGVGSSGTSSIKNGNSSVSRNSSIRSGCVLGGPLMRKKSREAEDINRWSDPAKQISQNSSIASRKTKNAPKKLQGILRKSNVSFSRGYASDDNFLKNKDILNVTSIVNENFDESRVFKSSASCVDLGTVQSVSRNVDLSNRRGYPNGNRITYSPPKPKAPSQRYGGFAAIELYPPRENWRIFRNLITIGFAFMLIFTAYNSTLFLQKSFAKERDLRTWHLVAECVAGMISATFLPTLVIKWLGSKWAMVGSCILCSPYFISQFVPEYATVLPTSAIFGVASSILWSSMGTYLTVMAEAYTVITDVEKDNVMMIFFGIYYFIFYSHIVWSSLAAYPDMIASNYTGCGSDFCPSDSMEIVIPNLEKPYREDYIIWGALIGLIIVASLVLAIGLDTLSRYNEGNRLDKTKKETECDYFSSSLKHFMNRFQIFLVPMILLISMSQTMLTTDFTIGYISCVWGVPHYRDIMICYGVFLLIFCLIVGSIAVRTLGRTTVLMGFVCLFVIVLGILKFWNPIGHKTVVFFIIAAIWAIPHASTVVISAMHGILFVGKEEQAYSCWVFWRYAGQLIIFSVQPYVCMNVIILIVFIILIFAVAGYIAFEMTWYRQKPIDNQRALSAVSSDGMVEVPLGNQLR